MNNAVDIGNDFRSTLKRERIRRRISQTELAHKVGKSRKWLSDFERGVIDPSFISVFALAIALDVRISYLEVETLE